MENIPNLSRVSSKCTKVQRNGDPLEWHSKKVSWFWINDIDVMNIPDGRLVKTTNRVKAPLSKKHLIQSLLIYFKEDQDMVKNLSSHIMDTRQVKVVERIQKKK